MEGLIVLAKYGTYKVISDNVLYSCSVRGNVKKNKKPTVGDYVIFDEKSFIIEEIKERKTLLKRPNIANIDQLLIIFSLIEPEFSYLLAFKYLTYANKYNLDSKIILTKSDREEIDKDKLKEIKETFKKIGVDVYVISSKTKEGLDEINGLFKGKISALLGQSGVGKSSLLNAINNDFKRSIGEYSMALGRGKHETKETILLSYEGGFIADTPGFSSLDLELYKEDLAKYFPSFDKYMKDCFYNDCIHVNEPKCRIKEAVELKEIPQIAYDCYLKLSSESISYIKRYQ